MLDSVLLNTTKLLERNLVSALFSHLRILCKEQFVTFTVFTYLEGNILKRECLEIEFQVNAVDFLSEVYNFDVFWSTGSSTSGVTTPFLHQSTLSPPPQSTELLPHFVLTTFSPFTSDSLCPSVIFLVFVIGLALSDPLFCFSIIYTQGSSLGIYLSSSGLFYLA